jgi:hypothetical protein
MNMITTSGSRLASTLGIAALLCLLVACPKSFRGGELGESSADNDGPANAQSLGTISPGGAIAVTGSISGFGADQFDSYRIQAGGATNVLVDLTPSSPAAVDLDLWLADSRGAVRQVFGSTALSTESGQFGLMAGETAILVVTGQQDATYRLNVKGEPAVTP